MIQWEVVFTLNYLEHVNSKTHFSFNINFMGTDLVLRYMLLFYFLKHCNFSLLQHMEKTLYKRWEEDKV